VDRLWVWFFPEPDPIDREHEAPGATLLQSVDPLSLERGSIWPSSY
jgi:hypothetical protein